jgi:hypothetical protein
MKEPSTAIQSWRSGLDCNYGDANGASVGNRLLLFAVSILREDLVSKEKPLRLLEEKANDPRLRSWPGPLVDFCLSAGRRPVLFQEAKPPTLSELAALRFYEGLIELRDGVKTITEFKSSMRELAERLTSDTTEEKAFTGLLRTEEFFIMRHEASIPD